MGNAGYASANHTSYWRMYSGHNCTNYAAFRMIKAGMPLGPAVERRRQRHQLGARR